MAESPLISTADLAARLGDPRLRLADVRWCAGEPARGRVEYPAGHLPGAGYLDLDADLAGPTGPGRHPLPAREAFATSMGSRGLGNDDLIVAYDASGGIYAARLWWMLRWIGHPGARLLDGGLPAWVAAGLPLTAEEPRHEPAVLHVRRSPVRLIDRNRLWVRLGKVTLLDARPPERYTGQEDAIDPVGGHIPTARNAPTADNLGRGGCFLPPEELARRYRALGVGEGDTVASCGSGVTACHDIAAMLIAGLPEPILYPGSWSDWCTSGLPYAAGPEPGAI